MNFIEIEKPHGFLVWKGKQKSIVNDSPLPVDEKLGLLSDGELYGEIILDEPQELNVDEIKEIDSHRLRDYEIKMMWSDVDKLYLHEIKNFEPYDEMIPAHVNDNGEIVLDEVIEPDESQKELLEVAESLPNQILIDKNAVQLTQDKQVINGESIKDLLTAAFGDVKEYETKADSVLPLYQLALVRSPVLRFKEFIEPQHDIKQEDDDMPYEKIERGNQICVVNTETDKVEQCYSGDDADEQANDLLAALQINVEDEESKSEIVKEEEKAGRRLKGSWLKKLKELQDVIKEMVTWADKEDDLPELPEGFNGFGIKETKQGPIFYTFATNAFEDREGELFSTKALENYVEENSVNENKGYFNLFHMQGTDFAKKEFQMVVGRFLLESGPFLNTEVAKQIKKFLKKYPKNHPELAPEGWGASIEYKYLPEQRMKGIYEWVWITRTSLLPKAAAANINTTGALKMDAKQLNPAQAEMGKEALGAELFNRLVEEGEIKTAKLEEELNFKDNEEPVENPDEDKTEVEAESESTDEEPVEEVETESVEEETVEEETVETPDKESVDVEQIMKNAVSELANDLKSELEIIATFPEAIKELNERMDAFESNAIKQAEKPRFSLLANLESQSVKNDESEETLTEEEVKEKGPQESESKGFIESRINRS